MSRHATYPPARLTTAEQLAWLDAEELKWLEAWERVRGDLVATTAVLTTILRLAETRARLLWPEHPSPPARYSGRRSASRR